MSRRLTAVEMMEAARIRKRMNEMKSKVSPHLAAALNQCQLMIVHDCLDTTQGHKDLAAKLLSDLMAECCVAMAAEVLEKKNNLKPGALPQDEALKVLFEAAGISVVRVPEAGEN